MSPDPEVIRALEHALVQLPDSAALRSHLVGLLCAVGKWDEALRHCQVLLEQRPDDRQALEAAARTCDAAGDHVRAASYRRLSDALSAADEPPPTAPPAPGTDPSGPPADQAGRENYSAFLRDVPAAAFAERSVVRLTDVGGMDEVKQRLQTSFLGPLRHPELRQVYGTALRGGLLMYGPPGCGKTFLARAVAGEMQARFLAVGLHDVLDMWVGGTERNVHEVFQTARRWAPSVLFLDEVDALGAARSRHFSSGRNLVVQLLDELDSVRDDNDGVFVLAATNQPWNIDPALRRPGRLDRTLLVLPPDRQAREAVLAYHLRDRPTVGVDLTRLADLTEGFSGADLRLVCDAAAEEALSSAVTSGRTSPIGQRDLERAAAQTVPSTLPWFETAKNHVMFANASGAYDDLLAHLRARRLL